MMGRHRYINKVVIYFLLYIISFSYICTYITTTVHADIVYVDVKSNTIKSQFGCGKYGNKCKSLSDALRRAKNGDTIVILPGIYSGINNNDLCSPNTNITTQTTDTPSNITSFNISCPKNLTFMGNSSFPEDIVIKGNHSMNVRALYALDASYRFSHITFSDFSINESIATITSLNGIDAGVGAAILGVGSKITLNNVIFKNNQAKQGGALAALLGSTVVVRHSSFATNQATDSGGALVLESSILHMHDSSLWLNSVHKVASHSSATPSFGGGGAVLLLNSLDVLIENCQLYNNSSPRSGGALHVVSSASPTSLVIANSTFSRNTVIVEADCQGSAAACVANGGALYIDSGIGIIDGCTFHANIVNSKLAIPVSVVY